MTYGGPVPTFTDTITGFVNGDAPASSRETRGLSTTALHLQHPGSYPITVDVSATVGNQLFVRGTGWHLDHRPGGRTPTITWANPADITYGTALSATQLDATATVPGSFVYTPATGTVLSVGTGHTLSVTFTPTDTVDYNAVTIATAINVEKATPVLTWANPASISYGTALRDPARRHHHHTGQLCLHPADGHRAGRRRRSDAVGHLHADRHANYNAVTTTATINDLRPN